ncbi:hypothetical protein [Streptomyces hydrogenans]|uniref:hypothetical protein n=1 Tax=Streptomyces hydrogenans TaxID=1873719 RepID=UPI00382E1F2D
MAEDAGPIADEAALAARLDPRWDRLSNALSDVQEVFSHWSTVEDTTLSQEQRDAARVQADQLNAVDLVRAIDQECRKAMV